MEKFLEYNLLLPYIAISIPLFVLVYFLFRNKSLKAKMIFLYSAWIVGLLLLFVNKAYRFARGDNILALLPLHLCYVSLLFFIPMALYFKKKVFYDFIFYINSLGAFLALWFPAKDYVDGMWSMITATYVIFHCVIVCIPLWLFMWKMYSPKVSLGGSLTITAILIGLSLIMHGINLFLVEHGVPDANYFWTMLVNSQYNVSVFKVLTALVPFDYLYLLVFVPPILAGYILLWNSVLRLVDKHRLKALPA